MDKSTAEKILAESETIYSAGMVECATQNLAREVTASLRDSNPIVLITMIGAVVFAGRLLPHLKFPLEVDYIHATRYGATSLVGGEIVWKVGIPPKVAGRTVLVLDDILDTGETLLAIRERCLELEATAVYSCVLTNKHIGKPKVIVPTFAGLPLPNKFVFGCGMDIYGYWRNLPSIHAVVEEK